MSISLIAIIVASNVANVTESLALSKHVQAKNLLKSQLDRMQFTLYYIPGILPNLHQGPSIQEMRRIYMGIAEVVVMIRFLNVIYIYIASLRMKEILSHATTTAQ